jgi:lysophospholipase L1-like esterase
MNTTVRVPPVQAPRPVWNPANTPSTPHTALWAYGDSWLYRDIPILPELVTALPEFGYRVVDASFADTGSTLAWMASRAEDFSLKLAQAHAVGQQPKAILLGGGGNDLVQPKNQPHKTPLFAMLDPVAAVAEQATVDFIDGSLAVHYRSILDAILAATPADPAQGGAPVFMHAYDHPTPDGRHITIPPFITKGPWLKPVFEARGMRDVVHNRQRMRALIDRLNHMLAGLTQEAAYRGRVWHLKLTGVLATDPLVPDAHHALWHDELHPHAGGYRLLAQEIARQLRQAGVT